MANITFTKDFTANQFFFDRPSPNPQTHTFKSGERVATKVSGDFGGGKHLLATFNGIDFDITAAVYKGEVVSDGSGLPNGGFPSSKSFFTPKNIIIGILAIGVIIGGLKLAKVF